MPEPSQPAGAAGVRRPGPVAVVMSVTGPVVMSLARLVSVASVTRARRGISHGIQDARKIRLQHLDNSHPHAAAKDPQQARRGVGDFMITVNI
jgi:hypothetical protein